jgi:hypothetical protein
MDIAPGEPANYGPDTPVPMETPDGEFFRRMIHCKVCHCDIAAEALPKHRRDCQGFASRCLEHCPRYKPEEPCKTSPEPNGP